MLQTMLDETMTNNGTLCLLMFLRDTLYNSLKEKGKMQDPESFAEDNVGQMVGLFNEVVFFLWIAHYEKVSENFPVGAECSCPVGY